MPCHQAFHVFQEQLLTPQYTPVTPSKHPTTPLHTPQWTPRTHLTLTLHSDCSRRATRHSRCSRSNYTHPSTPQPSKHPSTPRYTPQWDTQDTPHNSQQLLMPCHQELHVFQEQLYTPYYTPVTPQYTLPVGHPGHTSHSLFTVTAHAIQPGTPGVPGATIHTPVHTSCTPCHTWSQLIRTPQRLLMMSHRVLRQQPKQAQSNSSMHHYECVVQCKDNTSLQRGRI